MEVLELKEKNKERSFADIVDSFRIMIIVLISYISNVSI